MTYIAHTEQPVDAQSLAQAELEHHISQQAQAVAPEEFTSIEIDFYNHEIYAYGQLIAHITYDHRDFVTQRWLVIVNDKEEFRADTWGRCYRYIYTHHLDGSLPVQEEAGEQGAGRQGEEFSPLHPAPCPVASCTGNEIMVQIFKECENLGLELLDDGIYRNDEKLGQVGCAGGNWWFTRTSDANQQQVFCNSASDAVWYVSRSELPGCADFVDEYLQYRPLEQMPSVELKHLLDSAEFVAA
ncbi:hypothetical protein H6G80_29475 [Nostoc sp. FACHB-87]|uniref:hypothetical protein n=1 Tax=Nostocaceae TaxID=1162 RepID=UPI0016853101|nr:MULTISPECIES: hypothetical protein [Nostocaceae]MBD2458184.1 hypothetical protein [Nostoc sp. FACHB-87]MBD2479399.1 hypothetical protein [Anabaena sp. FACHB-83]